MIRKSPLNLKSLKGQVYDYLRDQMQKGALKPGSSIDMDETCRKLGVSRTPLREALLQLETEGFVTIRPRRGVFVNTLTLAEIRSYYEIISALEARALELSFNLLKPSDLQAMERLIEGMRRALADDDFDRYYECNLNFHDVYISPCGNAKLFEVVNILKKRLYDFPRQARYIKEWEMASVDEHRRLLRLIREGRKPEAVRFIEDVHWSFDVQEKFITKYYPAASSEKPKGKAARP